VSIESACLYVVATPIGNLRDLSARAQAVLAEVNLVAAEDTRHSRPLLDHFGIKTPLLSLHEHNEQQATGQVLARLRQGESVALISDAGTPLVSDPGMRLVQAAHREGFKVSPIAGPSALAAALSAGGLPADRFLFEGFLPSKTQARRHTLAALEEETRTLVFYEAPHRILDCLDDLCAVFGEERQAVLAKELSKLHETIYPATLAGIRAWLGAESARQKGEFVLLVAGAPPPDKQDCPPESLRVLTILRAELPLKQAAKLASAITGTPKNLLYQHALAMDMEK
jgi:16S rRNA (cytidine1402-2'-O)-methyltransferase